MKYLGSLFWGGGGLKVSVKYSPTAGRDLMSTVLPSSIQELVNRSYGNYSSALKCLNHTIEKLRLPQIRNPIQILQFSTGCQILNYLHLI